MGIVSGMGCPPQRAGKNPFEAIGDWCRCYPRCVLTLLTVAALAPFLNKPFNIDDPLFVWAAQHIKSHPADPYGFSVNWFGTSEPMPTVMLNPPLLCYYLALAAGCFGWGELGLHFACLLPAVGVVLGTYELARSLCKWPMVAALATLVMPGFLVSSTTVMCDVPMLAFWIWAVVFWTQGIKEDNFGKLLAGGIFIALCILTKFSGTCLIPLLAAYSLIEKRAVGRWIVGLSIPVVVLCAHDWITLHVYGQPHFFAATQYAQTHPSYVGLSKLIGAFCALNFTGGCFAIALFCSPFLWSKRMLLLFAGGGALLAALAVSCGLMAENYSWLDGSHRMWVEIQLVLWSGGGVCVLALALAEAWQKRDSGSWLLLLWVWGTFIYTAFVYFMVNGRAILPMAPAVAILIGRRLELSVPAMRAGMSVSFIASAALSLLAAGADFQEAVIARKSSEQLCAAYGKGPGRLWFQGHWGFQYYMQSAGASPRDFSHLELAPGDIFVTPVNSVNLRPLNPDTTVLKKVISIPVLPWFATFNRDIGAGFYSSFWGPLPFAFGRIPPETVRVYSVR